MSFRCKNSELYSCIVVALEKRDSWSSAVWFYKRLHDSKFGVYTCTRTRRTYSVSYTLRIDVVCHCPHAAHARRFRFSPWGRHFLLIAKCAAYVHDGLLLGMHDIATSVPCRTGKRMTADGCLGTRKVTVDLQQQQQQQWRRRRRPQISPADRDSPSSPVSWVGTHTAAPTRNCRSSCIRSWDSDRRWSTRNPEDICYTQTHTYASLIKARAPLGLHV